MRDLLAEFIADCVADAIGPAEPADPMPCATCGGTDHQTLLHGVDDCSMPPGWCGIHADPEPAVSTTGDER